MAEGAGVAPGRVRAGLEAAAEVIARVRRDVQAGRTTDLAELAAVARAVRADLSAAGDDAREVRPVLLALLDEATALATALERERTRLGDDQRSAEVRRRAGSIYRTPAGS